MGDLNSPVSIILLIRLNIPIKKQIASVEKERKKEKREEKRKEKPKPYVVC